MTKVHVKQPVFEKMVKHISVDEHSGCWIWNGTRDKDGYGKFQVYQKWDKNRNRGVFKSHRAHRAMYELLLEPIPKGLIINHLCEVSACCNPFHLEPCTHRENLMYSDTLPRRNSRKTHCKRGHALEGYNLVLVRDGRMCRACANWHARRFRKKNRDYYTKYWQQNRERILAKRRERYWEQKYGKQATRRSF